jgi:aquaporin Z
MTDLTRKLAAEFAGTAILVFFGVGSAIFGFDAVGAVGVALSFGLVLLALAYAIGPVSGCHVNPAVTLGVLLRGGINATEAGGYWVAQILGGIAGAALLRCMTGFGKVKDQTGGFGTNDWGKSVSGPGAFVLEVVLTFLLVFVVLLVTHRAAAPGFAGLAIGLSLTVIHLVGIPLDGTSVNPARSIGPALFHGGDSLTHLWLFIVAPLIGAAVAALLVPLLTPPAPVGGAFVAGSDPTGADVPA